MMKSFTDSDAPSQRVHTAALPNVIALFRTALPMRPHLSPPTEVGLVKNGLHSRTPAILAPIHSYSLTLQKLLRYIRRTQI